MGRRKFVKTGTYTEMVAFVGVHGRLWEACSDEQRSGWGR